MLSFQIVQIILLVLREIALLFLNFPYMKKLPLIWYKSRIVKLGELLDKKSSPSPNLRAGYPKPLLKADICPTFCLSFTTSKEEIPTPPSLAPSHKNPSFASTLLFTTLTSDSAPSGGRSRNLKLQAAPFGDSQPSVLPFLLSGYFPIPLLVSI